MHINLVVGGAVDDSSAHSMHSPQDSTRTHQRPRRYAPSTTPCQDLIANTNCVKSSVRSVAHRHKGVACQAPCCVVLGTTQAVGLIGRERRADRARGKRDPTFRRLVVGLKVTRSDGEDARLALDHHVPGICRGRADQRDALGTVLNAVNDPLSSCAGLAPATAGEDEPGAPVPMRRHLLAPTPPEPRPSLHGGKCLLLGDHVNSTAPNHMPSRNARHAKTTVTTPSSPGALPARR